MSASDELEHANRNRSERFGAAHGYASLSRTSIIPQLQLWRAADGLRFAEVEEVAEFLSANHYLGAAARGFALVWEDGVMVFANPSSRRLPQERWVELTRWCIVGGKNRGSQQWSEAVGWLVGNRPQVSTVVSYSDPAQGHTGALYRACNWLWAPTWHRLRPPPTGNGRWSAAKQEAVKDRWVFPLAVDSERGAALRLNDESLRKSMEWAEYREPKTRRHKPVCGSGGGDHKRWRARGETTHNKQITDTKQMPDERK